MTERLDRHEVPGPLAGLRVLDLTDEPGMYCAKLIGDLGADVILIEPREGAAVRRKGPFIDGIVDPERSLTFLYLNTSKRGITLNVEHPDGQEFLRRLAARSDVLIEGFPVGYLDERGLGYATLSARNSGLVMTSITPFGRGGPWERYRGGDLVVQAVGGLTALCGFADGPPVKLGGNQGFQVTSQQAATGTMLAVYGRFSTGRGQHVDVSMQEAVAFSTQPAVHWVSTAGETLHRNGNDYVQYGTIIPCLDGFVGTSFLRPDQRARMLDWLEEEGLAADLRDERWSRGENQLELRRRIKEQVTLLCAERGKQALAAEGQRRRIWMTPLNRTTELVDDEHLRQRGYFVPVEHPDLGRTIAYPGRPYRLSATPWRISRPAPRVGEHNREVYGELGLTGEDLQALAAAGAV